jgi:hypothetical protein
MKPADALAKDLVPIEITGLQHTPGLVGTIIENHRGPHAKSRDRCTRLPYCGR